MTGPAQPPRVSAASHTLASNRPGVPAVVFFVMSAPADPVRAAS
jgi:hypothetical protein